MGMEGAFPWVEPLPLFREELKEASLYDYIIVNDKIDEAAAEFAAILKAEHCRYAHRRHLLESM